jgi:hypothetical protein
MVLAVVNGGGRNKPYAKAASAAAAKLEALGVPLLPGGNWSGGSLFEISAESGKCAGNGHPWADYYNENHYLMDLGVNRVLVAKLKEHGLYAEWINPGVLGVYSIN